MPGAGGGVVGGGQGHNQGQKQAKHWWMPLLKLVFSLVELLS